MSKFNETLSGETPVLVDFFATWCGPCQMMPPILDEVKQHYGGEIRVLKVDVDKNPKVAAAFRVQGVPTLALFKAGKELWRTSGVLPARKLIEEIQVHLNP